MTYSFSYLNFRLLTFLYNIDCAGELHLYHRQLLNRGHFRQRP